MARVLVTGGAGFIGSHIALTLLERGDEVVVLDNVSTGKRENIELFRPYGGKVLFVEGDTADPEIAHNAVKGVDIVFHQAALGSVPKSVAHPMASHHANVTGTLQLLIAAKEAKVKRFVNAASSSAYGDTPELPKREDMIANCFSPYAVTKLAQEQYCRAFSVSYGLETVSLRYFNVYGARQDPTSQYAAVIPKFFQSFLRNEPPIIYGDGEQTRDFTYVGDVVQANIKASEFEGAKGEVFNVAGGKRISINELAEKIAKMVGSNVKPEHVDARAGDIRDSLADISALKEKLGFTPKVSLDEGLQRAFAWYKEHLS